MRRSISSDTRYTRNNPVHVNVPLDDGGVSSMVCTQIVVDIIKYIVYQKQQIPYPYLHLKNIAVNLHSERDKTVQQSYTHQRKIRQAVLAYQSLEEIFQGLESELKMSSTDGVREVVLLMGATPVSPKDVFRIQLPTLCSTLCDSTASYNKSLMLLIRCLTSSSDLNEIFSKPVVPTNTYVLLNKKVGETSSEWFLPKDRYSVPMQGNQVYISLQQTVSILKEPAILNSIMPGLENISLSRNRKATSDIFSCTANCNQAELSHSDSMHCNKFSFTSRASEFKVYEDSVAVNECGLSDSSVSSNCDVSILEKCMEEVKSKVADQLSVAGCGSRWFQSRTSLKGFK